MLAEKDPIEVAELYKQHAALIGEQIADLRRDIAALRASGDSAGADRKASGLADLRAQRKQHRDAAKRYRQQHPTIGCRNSAARAAPMKEW